MLMPTKIPTFGRHFEVEQITLECFPSPIEALVNELQKPMTDETHLMISVEYVSQFGEIMCQNQTYFTRPVEKQAVLEPFTSIQSQIDQLNSMRLQSLKEAASEQLSVAMYKIRCAYMDATVKADAAT
ncbi:hypothetical protein PISL3812_01930 [Talaromyces islandicus]|uniref:Uncharacterized protein n=1 Tax=Talaromyces islandicus TaxID=28573 RepID=A0A0U1LNH6_TALIS|nr:hypothetical protein PISL3812_01930 [Talaromyces islandicus]